MYFPNYLMQFLSKEVARFALCPFLLSRQNQEMALSFLQLRHFLLWLGASNRKEMHSVIDCCLGKRPAENYSRCFESIQATQGNCVAKL